ncbi:uncharacterized protein LOC121414825 isoform X2 [Lytechinus variegatus]|uniref:uncharacterized protein LOC121414825 isoform X2 n=1 Tax=Lytechinus variegatus TaxID=7654 RepID=UPI001BB22535|nr:uncharacterized protein LOC121414825 isoform X2 [Lytechinus variegatus]
MAILTRCCCFKNVRSGSTASGVYSLIYCFVSVGILLWEFVGYIEMSSFTGAARQGLYAAYSIDLVALTFLFIASIILLVGVAKISTCIYLAVWAYLLAIFVKSVELSGASGPAVDGIYAAYIIDIIVAVFLIIASIVLLVGVSKDNKEMLIPYMVAIMLLMVLQAIAWIIIFALLGLAGTLFIGNIVVWLLFTALNITCLLCVISQYQELRDGRGKANDVV